MGATATAQALPRDLSLDPASGALLQQLSPELQLLRTGSGSPSGVRGLQLEVVADFTVSQDVDPQAEFGVSVLVSEDGEDAQPIGVSLGEQLAYVSGRAGPLTPPLSFVDGVATVHVHAIVDHSIVTAIVNNRTAVTRIVLPRDADSDRVVLFGVDGVTIKCSLQVWALRDANIHTVRRS
jgi:hypothetical protein